MDHGIDDRLRDQDRSDANQGNESIHEEREDMFRPPRLHGLATSLQSFDRSLIRKTIPLTSALIRENKDISNFRTSLRDTILREPRISPLAVVKDRDGDHAWGAGKKLWLKPEIQLEDRSTWGETLEALVKEDRLRLMDDKLELSYDHWNANEIWHAIIPESENATEDIPSGFSIVGHVAHFNLREWLLPYKEVIAQILLDKVSEIKTVINKIDMVGVHDPYRTFKYEVLAGPDDMNVSVKHAGCIFEFNFSKVYFNTRLHTEHERIISLIQEGEAVCDVMAGVGPFSIPLGKKNVWVFANDLNPESYRAMSHAVQRNNVTGWVVPSNQDGHAFIREASDKLRATSTTMEVREKPTKSQAKSRHHFKPKIRYYSRPQFFDHYVMNLPDSAVSFLPNFIGLYEGLDFMFESPSAPRLPLIHVYTFTREVEDDAAMERDICTRVGEQWKREIRMDDKELELKIIDVRNVAPNKRMVCVTVRLPKDVAFAKRI